MQGQGPSRGEPGRGARPGERGASQGSDSDVVHAGLQDEMHLWRAGSEVRGYSTIESISGYYDAHVNSSRFYEVTMMTYSPPKEI